MGSYLVWPVVGFAVLVGIALLLFIPGLWVLGVVALAVALVGGIVLGIGAAGKRAAGDRAPDVVDRRREHEARQRDQRKRRAR